MTGESPFEPRPTELPLPWGPVLRGLRWGNGSDVVLLLHDPGADIDAWGSLPAQLVQSLAFTVVAIDLPGHGLSDDPWEPARLADVIQGILGTWKPLTPSPIGMSHMARYDPRKSPSDVNEPLSLRTLAGRGVGVRVAQGEGLGVPQWTGEHSSPARRLLIAAGTTATAALNLATELKLAGLICLSPQIADEDSIEPATPKQPNAGDPARVPPSPFAKGEEGRGVRVLRRSPRVPKLLVAGALAENDLATARTLASAAGGWAVVTSVPVADRGTALLSSAWGGRVEEDIIAFLRECQGRAVHSPRGTARRSD